MSTSAKPSIFKTRLKALLTYMAVGPIMVVVGSFFGAGMLDGVAGSDEPGAGIGYFFLYLGFFVTAGAGLATILFSIFDVFRYSQEDPRFKVMPFAYIVLLAGVMWYLPTINHAISSMIVGR